MGQVDDALEALDERIASLRKALEEQDWSRLGELNQGVTDLIDPVMLALERGELSPTAVQQRLLAMRAFVDDADREARAAREQARQALEEVGRNRKAASAYARVSTRKR